MILHSKVLVCSHCRVFSSEINWFKLYATRVKFGCLMDESLKACHTKYKDSFSTSASFFLIQDSSDLPILLSFTLTQTSKSALSHLSQSAKCPSQNFRFFIENDLFQEIRCFSDGSDIVCQCCSSLEARAFSKLCVIISCYESTTDISVWYGDNVS